MTDPSILVSARRLPPFPGSTRLKSPKVEDQVFDEEITAINVRNYLRNHLDVLESCVLEFIDHDVLEVWYKTRAECFSTRAGADHQVNIYDPAKLYHETDFTQIQQVLLKKIFSNQEFLPLMYELCTVIGYGINADFCTLYTLQNGGKDICMFIPGSNEMPYTLQMYGAFDDHKTIASHVCVERRSFFVPDVIRDDRFPSNVGTGTQNCSSAICAPLLLPTRDLLCIMEFVKSEDRDPFDLNNFELVNASLTWIGMTLYQCQINKTLMKQSDLNDFLLEISKIIFDDMIAMDKLVEKIMIYTKSLVHADRCALFLLDPEKQELCASLFDEGNTKNGRPVFVKKDEVRVPIEKGIVGYVARTGEVVNIPDAYQDPRFNRDIDKRTGYTTRSILCMPIISKGIVVGVVQMINKRADGMCFTIADESSFKMFSVYCSLALHYSKMYRTVSIKTAEHAVAVEQLAFHAKVTEDEVTRYVRRGSIDPHKIPQDFESFFYYPDTKEEPLMPLLYMHMMDELFGEESFDRERLIRFTLLIRKNYRTVPYHNFKHGFVVAHAMFMFLSNLSPEHREKLPEYQQLALMVNALCHDVDHRGLNNAFLQRYHEPLAVLYETSTLEHHHFAVTMKILNHIGFELFVNMPPEEHKLFIEFLHQCVLDTDISLHMQTMHSISERIHANNFSMDNDDDIKDIVGLLVTSADLINLSKAWPANNEATGHLYEEFYSQGDLEKQMGSQPVEMMDREYEGQFGKQMVSFFNIVGIPCFSALAAVFQEFEILLAMCKDNRDQWQRVVDGQSTQTWEPAKSVVQQDSKHDQHK